MNDAAYIRFDPGAGDMDVDIKCQEVRIVTVRKPQPCWLGMSPDRANHNIEPGQRARFEKAIVDGDWRSYYCCLPCIEKELTEWQKPLS